MNIEEKREKARLATQRYRERRRAAGSPPEKDSTAVKAKRAGKMRLRRQAAAERGEKIASETWWIRNRDRHRENVTRWRAENLGRSREIVRESQAVRRSTPWGQINNRLWPVMHASLRAVKPRGGKYTLALGYSWQTLRAHIEAKFLAGMTWDNWGDVWEIDHIKPVSSFRYASLDDPLFREAWSLENLRPLWREANAAKGSKAA